MEPENIETKGNMFLLNKQTLLSEGYIEFGGKNITSSSQLAISTSIPKSFCFDGNSYFICSQDMQDKSFDYAFLSLLNKISHPKVIFINHKELLDGMLYAIGIDDINVIKEIISTYAESDLKTRLGQLRQHLIEDQIRYLETLLSLRKPYEIRQRFVLNPQAERGINELCMLFDRFPLNQKINLKIY